MIIETVLDDHRIVNQIVIDSRAETPPLQGRGVRFAAGLEGS